MKCVEVEQQIDSFIDGEISSFHKKQIENHLENCDSCSQNLEKLQSVSGLLKSSLPVATSTQLDARVMEAFRQHQHKQPIKTKPVGIWASIFGQLVIPKPILALSLLAFAVLTGLAFQLGRMTSTNVQTQVLQIEKSDNLVSPKPQTNESVQTKIVEIPVTKYVKVPVVKEKIVTQTVYKTVNSDKKVTNKVQKPNSDNLMINNLPQNDTFLTQISLKDYSPVSEIKIKVFKKGENINE